MIAPAEFLLTLAGVHHRHIGQAVWSGAMVHVLSEVGIPESACRVALSRLTARGVVTREYRGRLTFYRITDSAAEVFDSTERRVAAFGLGVEPGYTILWHTLPESNRGDRNRLSRRLRFIGFGSAQDGMWIALQDRYGEANEIVDRLGLGNHCSVFSGHGAANPGLLAEIAWNLSVAKKAYRDFLSTVAVKNVPRSNVRDIFMFRALMAHEYRTFPMLDPECEGLDPELDALRSEVVGRFHELYVRLQAKAEQHANELAIPKLKLTLT